MPRSAWIKAVSVAAAVLMAAVLFIGAKGIGKVNSVPPLVHKFEHFFYYGGMAALLAFAVGQRRWWIPVLVVALVGLLDEWHQFYVPGRNSSPVDWMVDVAGAALAAYLFHRWSAARGVQSGNEA